ncbi:MAG: hypothetical protein ACKVT0_23060 [Planctomycetaceae bacterium]
MTNNDNDLFWWGSVTFRITHPNIDPSDISDRINVALQDTDIPGKLEVTCGHEWNKTFWFGKYRIESPCRPDVLIAWVESFADSNKPQIADLMALGCKMYVYVGIHAKVLCVGFDLPATPTLWELNIPIGIEFFSS